MKIAHGSCITIAATAASIVINVVVGQFIRNIFTHSYHFFSNRIMNRIPVIVCDMVSIAIVLNSLAILRCLIIANTLRTPLPVFGTTCIITKLYDSFIVKYFIFGSKHLRHAVLILAQWNIANMCIRVIRVCGIKWERLISFFEINVARGRNFIIDNGSAWVEVAVFAFVITDAQNNRLILL